MNKNEYKIISDKSLTFVEEEVTKLLNQGWALVGSVSVATMPHYSHQNGYLIYSQSLLRTTAP